MSQRNDDVGTTVFAFAVVLAVVIAVWMHWFASCDALGWIPAAEIPARCLMR